MMSKLWGHNIRDVKKKNMPINAVQHKIEKTTTTTIILSNNNWLLVKIFRTLNRRQIFFKFRKIGEVILSL